MFVAQAIGEHAAGFTADLGLADGLSLDTGEGVLFFNSADFGWQEIGVVSDGCGGDDDLGGGGGRIDHHLENFVGHFAGFEFLEAIDAGVELQGSTCCGTADFGDDDVVGETEGHHVDDVFVGDSFVELLAPRC